ncbi:hypothetical protein [Lysinibacillus sp. FN11]|uniref:hypothetical protein n=1 Tax=Lysinibacillus sp. FN11 TaxID=2968499 RepID=UPI00214C6D33|nr:hypothetical protein [Lysinibacillus sp. FN11]UUV25747.1 hypothetical protein NP781_03795 [Lysinibacillus sp. FN11]
MNTFIALRKKEMNQMTKEYKVVWLPIVYILLGLTQPIMMYFLPAILQSMGGIEGIIIDPSMTKPGEKKCLLQPLIRNLIN